LLRLFIGKPAGLSGICVTSFDKDFARLGVERLPLG
jgi:hypothetical protein